MKDYEQLFYELKFENKHLKSRTEDLEEELDYLSDHKENIVVLNRIMLSASKKTKNQNNYKEYYYEFWIPILQKQYFKYKLMNDTEAIIDLEANIWKNWNFTKKEKREILKKIRGEKCQVVN